VGRGVRNAVVELPPVTSTQGRFMATSFTFRDIGNPDTALQDLANFMVERTTLRVLNIDTLRGWVTMHVEGNSTTHTFPTPLRVNEITVDVLRYLIDQGEQSNEELHLLDLEFEYNAVDLPLRAGAATTKPKWWPKSKWDRLWDTPPGTNCVAYALCHCMKYTSYHKVREGSNVRGFNQGVNDSRGLMDRLNWGENVDLADIGKFVELEEYKDKQVVIISASSLKTAPIHVFTGVDFDPEIDEENGEYAPMKKHRLYLYFDATKDHVTSHFNPSIIANAYLATPVKWCYQCHYSYTYHTIHQHDGIDTFKRYDKAKVECPKCYVLGEHTCPLITCRSCAAIYKRGGGDHRCIVTQNERQEKKNQWCTIEGGGDGTVAALWAWDIETRIVKTLTNRETINSFATDENGRFTETGEDGFVEKWAYTYDKHQVNFVHLKNVFTGEERNFNEQNSMGMDPLQKMLEFLKAYNKSNNVCCAHNSKSYDSRVLVSVIYEHFPDDQIKILKRGQMINEIKLGARQSRQKVIFRDSLLHLTGSLAGLANSMCPGELEKGYFPHRFNSPENYGYVGPLPAKKEFDIYFSAKNQQDVDKFNTWWESRRTQGEWNFHFEMLKYNRNDVHVLAEVMKIYHDTCMDMFEMTPWANMTAPSYVHEVSLRENTKLLEDEYNLVDLRKNNWAEYNQTIQNLTKKAWAVLKPYEYAACRASLRGGRTECLAVYVELTQEEKDRGDRIKYIDITSSYPFQQVKQIFPTGIPDITVYDQAYAPCILRGCENSTMRTKCDHDLEFRFGIPFKKSVRTPSAWEILNDDTWFGFACVTLIPCKMLSPVIAHYDQEKRKLVIGCEKLVEVWVNSMELKVALKYGYELERIHSFHKYNQVKGFNDDMVCKLFVKKECSSRDEPEDMELYAQKYDEEFSTDFGDLFRDTVGKGLWGRSNAKRQVYKILLNCLWGKHAQNPHLKQAQVLHEENDGEAINALLNNSIAKKYVVKNIENVGPNLRCFEFDMSVESVDPDLHKSYLPAACFVTSYGRLQLWSEMNRIEMDPVPGRSRRVVYCDTDSLMYHAHPEKYNTKESDLFGGWLNEHDANMDGIVEMVGLGPKTYAYKHGTGAVSECKTKGVRLSYATQNIANFQSFKDMALRQLTVFKEDTENGVEDKRSVKGLLIPQRPFVFNRKREMTSANMLKKIRMNINEIKGELQTDGILLPFGYNQAPPQEIYDVQAKIPFGL